MKYSGNPTTNNNGVASPLILRCKSYIQPFERFLAASELQGLLGGQKEEFFTEPAPDVVTIKDADGDFLKKRLAYWETIEVDGVVYIPDQVLHELSDEEHSPQLTFDGIGILPQLPKRRKLRYGVHDLHDYRGKFFPQLVRSLINSAGLPEGALVLDPTCGSGTTNVEARALNMRTIGADLNPLSVFISKVKTSVFDLDRATLTMLRDEFVLRFHEDEVATVDIASRWGEKDLQYLERWFDPRALQELAYLLVKCDELKAPLVVDFLKVCMSNIIRTVSWQNDDDLRVRKNIAPYEKNTALKLFQIEVLKQTKKILGYVSSKSLESVVSTTTQIIEGDARSLTNLFPDYVGQCDAIITSPPYATALPYIDTDRLSLIVLGLLPRSEHRDIEYNMIGNREILEKQRVKLWEAYQERRPELPGSITSLIDELAHTNHEDGVGFRRRNLPALLSKYFLDMLDVMRQSLAMMSPGGYAFFVVGNNSTTVNGNRVDIATDNLLWELGEKAGWSQVANLGMELLPSRDIFRKNRGSSESILVFKAGLHRKSIYGSLSNTSHRRSDEWDFADEDTQEHLHTIHPYPARFIPQIPRKAILEYSQPGDTILDPFVGSGTTLLEASLLGRTSIGVDNNAVATLVSRAKISQYTTNDLQALDIFCQNLPDARTLDISSELVDIPLYKELDGWFAAEATRDLGFIREQINGLKEPIQSLALATLSSIIVRVSYQDSDTRYTRVRKEYKSGSALKWYKQKLFQAIGGAREIANHSRAASSAHLADARKLSFVDDRSVDLIVTSPPYLNAYDYHKYHRHRLHWISGDVLLAREKEIGKHDTFTKKRAIPDPYFSDMYQCFSEWSRVIKPGGTVLIVIGDAIVSGVPVPVGDTFIELLTELGFVLKNRWVRTVKSARKSFNGRARIQKEHVLLFVYK